MAGVPSRAWELRRRLTERIVGVDVARCVALVGMICTHLVIPMGRDGRITVLQQVAGGRSAALFAVLAGVSTALVTGGAQPVAGSRLTRARWALVVRAALIAALGLWLAGLDSGIAVILPYYGVLFLLGVPFLRLRPGALAVLAAAVAVIVPVVSHLLRPHLPAVPLGQPTVDDLASPGPLLADLTFTGTYPAVAWTAYLFLGMALGRLRLRRPDVAVRVALSGGALAIGGWLVGHLATGSTTVQAALTGSLPPRVLPWPAVEQRLIEGLAGTTPTDTWWWLLVAAPHSTTTFDLAQTGGSAMVALGLCLLVTRWQPRFWSVACGAGAMTLSLYTFHVVLASSGIPRTAAYAVQWHLLLVLAIGAVFAAARLRGPLEWLVGGVAATVGDLLAPALHRSTGATAEEPAHPDVQQLPQ